jgi:glycosyltransferase involved in cell wall biosynthesis
LDKAKGIDLLCQAFLRLTSLHNDVLLRIAGWGPLDRSLREEYKNSKNIEFIGPVSGSTKKELFRKSDVLVAPSVIPEPFGIVIIEAFTQGLPVITSKTGAFSEIVREGETGLLVNPESVDALFSAMVKVSEEHALLSRMSGNCIEEARKYTSEKLIKDFLDVYSDKLD